MLLRLAHLTVVNTFAVLRLLAADDRDKDTEILVLRHPVAVLERQLGGKKVRFTFPDRALLAALLHRLRPQSLRRMRLLVRRDTVLRWHRDLVRKQHAGRSRPAGLAIDRTHEVAWAWAAVAGSMAAGMGPARTEPAGAPAITISAKATIRQQASRLLGGTAAPDQELGERGLLGIG